MIDWHDEAILLSARRHGENARIVSLLTREHGRHAGLVRGGQSRRQGGVLQPGNRIAVTWRARLEEHLGTVTVEPVRSYAALLLDDSGKLLAMNAALTLVEETVAEREPVPGIFDTLGALMIALDAPNWAETYARWELGFLGALGFGLDLSACAATGEVDDLAYVSPRSGRAVSRAAGAPYSDRLLILPGFLIRDAPITDRDLCKALTLSGFFLKHHLFNPMNRPLPDARLRLADRLC